MRYQFYKEHKYVSAALNDLERSIAQADFNNDDNIEQIYQQLDSLMQMLTGHAEYEDTRIHTLLKAKGSMIYANIEKDHMKQENDFATLKKRLAFISESTLREQRIVRGYEFYLCYRKFVADTLQHLHQEETVILPELQRLYSDDELQRVEYETYHSMTAEQIIAMFKRLFNYMNPNDKMSFLADLKTLQPNKYSIVKTALPINTNNI